MQALPRTLFMNTALVVQNLQNNIFAGYHNPITATTTQTDGCHSYDAAKKTRNRIMHVNGMPKANMFVETRAMISAFDLNRVLSESGTTSTLKQLPNRLQGLIGYCRHSPAPVAAHYLQRSPTPRHGPLPHSTQLRSVREVKEWRGQAHHRS